ASYDYTLKLWDAKTGAALATLTGHSWEVRACAYSPDGKHIVSASDDTTLKLWDAQAGAEIATLTGHSGSVHACAYSPDGKHIVSAAEDNTLKLWDAETAEQRTVFVAGAAILALAVARCGQFIALGDRSGRVFILQFMLPLVSVPLITPIHL